MINLEKFQKNINFSVILTTGRTGSDFLHACLDNIPGLVTLSGSFFYYNFLDNLNKNLPEYTNREILKIFIKKHKNLLIEDKIENKIINLDIKKFSYFFLKILKENKLNKKNLFLTIYLSYYLCVNKNLNKIKTIVHHSHQKNETKNFISDFGKKKVRLLVTVREPRANLKSGIVNWIKFDPGMQNQKHFLFYIKRIRQDLMFAFKKEKKMFIKLEHANLIVVKKKLLKFLGVNYNSNIKRATFLGRPWKGDKLSDFKNFKIGEYNKGVQKNNWEQFFSNHDKKMLNFLYYDYNYIGYKFKKININSFFYFFIFSFLPLSFEKKLFKLSYFLNFNIKLKHKFCNIYFFILRIIYFYFIFFVRLFSLQKNKFKSSIKI